MNPVWGVNKHPIFLYKFCCIRIEDLKPSGDQLNVKKTVFTTIVC